MIQRVLSIALISTTVSAPVLAQSLGKLTGKVTSKLSGSALPGASIVVDDSGFGTVADAAGQYVILGMPAGSYTIRASYVGYESTMVTGVVINTGYTRELDFDLVEEVSQLDQIVVEYERPMIQRDALGVPNVVTSVEIENLPIRGVKEVATMHAGVVAGEGREEVHVRGGREQETVYFVDGVKVIGYSAVPQQAILEQEMLIGSLPAKYGDAMSGIVSITTKSGGNDLFGSIEAISSEFLDGYGYDLTSASVGGPVFDDRLSFFVAGEYLNRDDASPSAIPIPTLRGDRLRFLQANPQSLRFLDENRNRTYLPFPGGLTPSVDSDGDGEPDAVTFADVWSAMQVPDGLELESPVPVQAAEVEPLNSYEFRSTRPNSGLDIIRSSGNLTYRPNGSLHFRAGFRHEDYRRKQIGSRQLLFSSDRFQQTDSRMTDFGVGMTHRLSGSSFYHVQIDWSRFKETTYDPEFSSDVSDLIFYGDIDNTANAVSTRYRIWDNEDSLYVPRFEDGQLPNLAGIYDVFNEPGYADLSYSKERRQQFRMSANATTQIGMHQIEFGGEFERRLERYYKVGAVALARYYDDGDVESGEGIGVSSYSQLPFLVVGSSVSYWGYDYLGLSEADEQDVERFAEGVHSACNDASAGPDPACNVAPYEPIYYAGYIQDKFEHKDLVLNLGLRVDVFDNNTFVLKDPFALVPIVRAGELDRRPANIGSDFAVYFDFKDNVVGYRDRDGNFFDALGQRALGVDLNLLGSPKVPEYTQAYLSPEVFEDYRPQVAFMPRVGLSFSITDQALFFAHLDKTSQRPFEHPFEGLHAYWRTSQQYGFLANNALLPETTIEYELGFRHRIHSRAAVSISGFYKKVDRLIRFDRIQLAFPNGYVTWANDDFGTIKGLEFELDVRRTRHLALTANYTLQYARGTGSDADWVGGRTWEDVPVFLTRLDFDQRHTFTANIDYRLGAGEGPLVGDLRLLENVGVNVLLHVHSGKPFTRQSDTPPYRVVGPTNGQEMSSSSLVNLRVDRRIELGDEFALTPFLWIENLFDVDNVRNVYSVTGRPDENGYRSSGQGSEFIARQEIPETAHTLYGYYVNRASNYGIPRLVRLGVRFNF